MTTETYAKAMAELGISRAGFESGAAIDGTPSGSQITPTKLPKLLKPRASTVPAKLPMDEVPLHLQCAHPQYKTASKWWDSLSPEERAKQCQKRSENAKLQGRSIRKAASVGAPAAFT